MEGRLRTINKISHSTDIIKPLAQKMIKLEGCWMKKSIIYHTNIPCLIKYQHTVRTVCRSEERVTPTSLALRRNHCKTLQTGPGPFRSLFHTNRRTSYPSTHFQCSATRAQHTRNSNYSLAYCFSAACSLAALALAASSALRAFISSLYSSSARTYAAVSMGTARFSTGIVSNNSDNCG